MTNTPPPNVPKEKTYLERLRDLTIAEILGADNPGDRRKFSDLLDLIGTPKVSYALWPLEIGLETARHPTRRAVVYAALLQALRLVWLEKSTPNELEACVSTAEKCRLDGRIVGDLGTGYTWETK